MPNAPLGRTASAILTLMLGLTAPTVPSNAQTSNSTVDTLDFEPIHRDLDVDSEQRLYDQTPSHRDFHVEGVWLQPPFRMPLSANRETLPLRHPGQSNWGIAFDYNRVDEVRTGVTYETQAWGEMAPRIGGRAEYAFGRDTWLYGAQLEQPLEPGNHVALGVSMYRRTDHIELQQVSDLENSLALLFGRQDYRDYFEREGFGGYLALRWPGVTTFSLPGRNDKYRTLDTASPTSWFHKNHPLRDNPPIDDGEAHVASVRLEHVHPGMEGFHHWVDLEIAGEGMGGDFNYRRLLADLRSVVRLSPAMSLSLRGVVGSGLRGTLPSQRGFTVGGVDGLRAHPFATFRGD